ncbi:hypothetical protein HX884_04030 [Enterobacter sp. SECR19-1250]|uniref:hypothetical protein n=1 Tax=Enterobacter sp. SECR19-1250 TaxID=2749084 RepID=UPI0015B6A61B|nr:hypothetical protein [Enterobacter sp. SECR19-1250]NWJ78811.1 hypothetical protein [Enterobacter sp. SECR19-1250]
MTALPVVLFLLLRHEDPQLFIHLEDTIMQKHHNGTAADTPSTIVPGSEQDDIPDFPEDFTQHPRHLMTDMEMLALFDRPLWTYPPNKIRK